MIEWNTPKRGGRASSSSFIAISVTSGGAGKLQSTNQLVIRFGQIAVKDLRLIAGDRLVIGLDSVSKQVCFKRTTDNNGYKLTGKAGSSLSVQATINLPILCVQVIEMKSVKVEGTHTAIYCPAIFSPSFGLIRIAT